MSFGYLVELARSASESERFIGTALPCAAGPQEPPLEISGK